MNNKLAIGFIVFMLSAGLFMLNLNNQKSYNSTSIQLSQIQEEDIKKILIQSGIEAIELMREDSTWSITGVDTLEIKIQSISNFFDNVLSLEIQTTMTEKQEKWQTFNVDDSTGTHVALVDWNDKTIGYFVFGRSLSDYSRCYVRTNDSPNVYLTNNNVMYNLQTRATFWGEKPQESIPEEVLE